MITTDMIYAAEYDMFYLNTDDGEDTLYVGTHLTGDEIDEFIAWIEKVKVARLAEKSAAQGRLP